MISKQSTTPKTSKSKGAKSKGANSKGAKSKGAKSKAVKSKPVKSKAAESTAAGSKPKRTLVTGLPFDPTNKDLPRGLRVYGAQLERVRAVLATPVAADARGVDALLGHSLFRAGLRAPFFMLQGNARASLGMGGDKEIFERIIRETKIVEDLSGDVDYWWSMLEKGAAWDLPEPLRVRAQERHHAASGRLHGWLEARAWLDHRYLPEEGEVRLRVHRMGRALRGTAWPSPSRERKELAAFLLGRVRSLESALKSLDLSEVESGIHEMRRKVRWISIYATALDGAVQLDHDAKPPKGWGRYLTPAVVENPFNALPKGDGTAKPVMIPAPLFYALSWLIAELGSIKDRAQWTTGVAEGLDECVGGGAKAKRWLGDLTLESREAGKLATAAVEKAIHDDKLLGRLADAFSAQL